MMTYPAPVVVVVVVAPPWLQDNKLDAIAKMVNDIYEMKKLE